MSGVFAFMPEPLPPLSSFYRADFVHIGDENVAAESN